MSLTLKEKTPLDVGSPVPGKATLFIDSADEKLKKKLSDGSVVTIEVPAASVTSVFGRSGVVTQQAGDYSGAQISNTPAGSITATNVQAAINELDTKKLTITHQGSGGLVHPLVSGAESGFMSPADKTKLDTIAANATANETDAFLLARANHTGSQLAATISDFTSAADARITAQKAQANGLATLDASSLLPAAQHGSYTDPSDHALVTITSHGFMASSDKAKLDGIDVGANATISSSATPQPVGSAQAGSSAEVSKADHVHAHGNQLGGSLHATATALADGFLSAADKIKLDGIATGATLNQTDAYLLSRANHTGTQASSTISDFNLAADARITAQKGAANGLATLGADQKIVASQIPALAITETFVVSSQAQMLALTAQVGDVAVRTDVSKSFILQDADPTVLSSWVELLNPGNVAVQSVNGVAGPNVVISTTQIGEGSNLYYQDSRVDARITLQKGAPLGVATLDASGLLPAAQHGSYTDPTDHAVVTTSANGFMSSSDKTKLNGIATGATANQTDAYLLNRGNHTGTQLAATISDFNASAASAAPVQSVAGKTGIVALNKNDVSLNNVDNTADSSKIISGDVTGTLGASAISSSVVMGKLLAGLSLPTFGQIQSSDTLIVALQKLMTHSVIQPITINQNVQIPTGYIWRRWQMTILTNGADLILKGNSRLVIRG